MVKPIMIPCTHCRNGINVTTKKPCTYCGGTGKVPYYPPNPEPPKK